MKELMSEYSWNKTKWTEEKVFVEITLTI